MDIWNLSLFPVSTEPHLRSFWKYWAMQGYNFPLRQWTSTSKPNWIIWTVYRQIWRTNQAKPPPKSPVRKHICFRLFVLDFDVGWNSKDRPDEIWWIFLAKKGHNNHKIFLLMLIKFTVIFWKLFFFYLKIVFWIPPKHMKISLLIRDQV
jgi:hypothetical protein